LVREWLVEIVQQHRLADSPQFFGLGKLRLKIGEPFRESRVVEAPHEAPHPCPPDSDRLVAGCGSALELGEDLAAFVETLGRQIARPN
jgi:hypothetical protein